MKGLLVLFVVLLMVVAITAPTPAPGGLTTRTFTAVIRDMQGSNCNSNSPDFENALGDDRGIVTKTLGADRKPVYASTGSTKTTKGASYFNQWFNDVSGFNRRSTLQINTTWDSANAVYTYYNSAFFPIDGPKSGCFGNSGQDGNKVSHNFGFCLELHGQFTYNGGEKFQFQGDDDIWVYINNRLFVDIGGVHGAEYVSQSLDANRTALAISIGGTYNFDFFFCERHTSQSNFLLTTSIPIENCPTVDACGLCNGPTTVDPCKNANCSAQGRCPCNGEYAGQCVCNPGWSGAKCDQFCGDGKLQGDEQCDPPSATGCCSSTCKFVSAGTNCNGTNVCEIGTCLANGTCSRAPVVCSSDSCNNRACSPSSGGACVATPFADGTVCGATGNTCTSRQCSRGVCTTVNNDGTTCGNSFNFGCLQATCSGGSCQNQSTNVGQVCNNGGNTPCQTLLCSTDGTCSASPSNSGSKCGTATECTQPLCTAGSCTSTAINNGGPCTSTPLPRNPGYPSCQMAVCNDQACTLVTNASANGLKCADDSTSGCLQYQCNQGACSAVTKNEGLACTTTQTRDSFCTSAVCQSGSCNVITANVAQTCVPSGQAATCYYYQCNNNGTCTAYPSANQTSCTISGSNDKCAPTLCNGAGTCRPVPVECPSSTECGGVGQTCDSTTGKCTFIGACQAGTQCCTAQCAFASNTASNGCPATTSCASYHCAGNNASCIKVNLNENGDCSADVDSSLIGECYQARCAAGTCRIQPTPAATNTACTSQTGSNCSTPQCDGTGRCTLVAKNGGNTCSDYAGNSNTQCNTFSCQGLTCSPTPVTGRTVNCTAISSTDCALAQCDATGGCSLKPLPDSTPCDSIESTDCAAPECDGTGNCVLHPLSADTECDLPPSECRIARCNGAGTCALIPDPAAVGDSCSTVFPQCLQGECAANGTCQPVPSDEGTPCSLENTNTCQVAQCDGEGACVLVPANEGTSCSAPADARVNACTQWQCVEGACTEANRPKDAACTDANLCDSDACDGEGTCVHTPSVVCNSPPNTQCYNSTGTCAPENGTCSYPVIEVSTCTPNSTVYNPKCDNYICNSGQCVIGCIIAVCGDGIVQDPEECDYASPLWASGCCTKECTFQPELKNCTLTQGEQEDSEGALENANITKSTSKKTKCIVGVCSSNGFCQPSWNLTIPGCAIKKTDNSLAIGLGVGLTGGFLLLILLVGLIILVAWRLMRSPISPASQAMMNIDPMSGAQTNPDFVAGRRETTSAVYSARAETL